MRRSNIKSNHKNDNNNGTKTLSNTNSTSLDNNNINNNNKNNTSMPSSEWDHLRREATKLERQLEDRVAKLQLLNANMHHATSSSNHGLMDAEMGNGNNSDMSESMSSMMREGEVIERTMTALEDLNERMANIAKRSGSSQQNLLVKRYREILFDYNADYQKAMQAMHRRRETSALFSGANMAMRNHENDSATEHLLRERNAISNSMKSAGTVLSQATEIRSDLRAQRSSLGTTMNYMTRIADTVPGLNQVMDAIRKKRNRDDIIVSAVIAACILFTLWYLFA